MKTKEKNGYIGVVNTRFVFLIEADAEQEATDLMYQRLTEMINMGGDVKVTHWDTEQECDTYKLR